MCDTPTFDAITIQSPMCRDGERKDQDRVCWFAPTLTACVCDGVSTSPFATEAAEIACQFSPTLFRPGHDALRRIEVLADFLITRRLGAQQSQPTMPNVTPAMMAMLQDAVKENMTKSYQTTLVTASFVAMDALIDATVIHIGDSGVFVFDKHGATIASSLEDPRPSQERTYTRQRPADPSSFEPGHKHLVRIISKLSTRPELAEPLGIPAASLDNWLICALLDDGERSQPKALRANRERLNTDDLIVVPRYLAQMPEDSLFRDYCLISCSRQIRHLRSQAPRATFESKTNVTAVLPDHVATACTQFQDKYPMDSHFVLASDGFYEAFTDPHEMWNWLCDYESDLRDEKRRAIAMSHLHDQLFRTRGDDDISFVWVRAE